MNQSSTNILSITPPYNQNAGATFAGPTSLNCPTYMFFLPTNLFEFFLLAMMCEWKFDVKRFVFFLHIENAKMHIGSFLIILWRSLNRKRRSVELSQKEWSFEWKIEKEKHDIFDQPFRPFLTPQSFVPLHPSGLPLLLGRQLSRPPPFRTPLFQVRIFVLPLPPSCSHTGLKLAWTCSALIQVDLNRTRSRSNWSN